MKTFYAKIGLFPEREQYAQLDRGANNMEKYQRIDRANKNIHPTIWLHCVVDGIATISNTKKGLTWKIKASVLSKYYRPAELPFVKAMREIMLRPEFD